MASYAEARPAKATLKTSSFHPHAHGLRSSSGLTHKIIAATSQYRLKLRNRTHTGSIIGYLQEYVGVVRHPREKMWVRFNPS